MKRELAKVRRDGYRIIYLDETCITRKTVPDLEWALPKENVAVDVAKIAEPCLSMLAAISKERGIEHYRIFPRSVNLPKFKEWLSELRVLNGDSKICLFMDNLSSHICDRTKNAMKEMGYRWAWSVPYSPE